MNEQIDRLGHVAKWLQSETGRQQSERIQAEVRAQNSEKVRKYRLARLHRDPEFKRIVDWRSRVNSCLFRKWSKRPTTGRMRKDVMLELVGCSRADLVAYLESLFTPEMTWQNHGRKGWHIDHIRPVYTFNLSTDEGFTACNHWTNLRPIWYLEHKAKSILELRLSQQRKGP